MTELWTTVTVECAHAMREGLGVPVLHGHSYWIQFFVASSSEAPVPLPVIQQWAAQVASSLDHRNIDDIMVEGTDPTMEAIAEYVAQHWRGPRLTRVVVRRDSLGCGVEWRP